MSGSTDYDYMRQVADEADRIGAHTYSVDPTHVRLVLPNGDEIEVTSHFPLRVLKRVSEANDE